MKRQDLTYFTFCNNQTKLMDFIIRHKLAKFVGQGEHRNPFTNVVDFYVYKLNTYEWIHWIFDKLNELVMTKDGKERVKQAIIHGWISPN